MQAAAQGRNGWTFALPRATDPPKSGDTKRHLVLALALAPLFLVGCKKKDPEPLPAAAVAAPALEWTWGPATFAGSRAEGNTGALTVPFTVKNTSSDGLVLQAVAVNIFSGDNRICSAKVSVSAKAPENGGTASGSVEIPCEYKTIPEGDKLTASTTAIYTLGGSEPVEKKAPASIPFTR